MTVLSRRSGGSGGGGAPSGPAGGDLTGTYPNPTIGAGKVTAAQVAADVATQAELDAVSATTYWDAVVRKTSNETISASAALQSDDQLLFTVLADVCYAFELWIVFDGANATMDFKHAFTISAGSFTRAWRQHIGLGPTTAIIQASQVADMSTAIVNATVDTTEPTSVKVTGSFTPTDAATVTLQWAQNVSDPGNLRVLIGSTLAYRALD